MNWKIASLATVTLMCGYTVPTYAHSPMHKGVEFHAGLSGGVNQMAGQRNENIFSNAANEFHTFNNNIYFKDSNAQYTGFAGFVWYVPSSNVFIGPEIHIGKTHTERRYQNALFDANVPGTRTLDSSITQSMLYGGVVRVGAYYQSYSGYLLIGGEHSQFQNYVNYGPIGDPASAFKSNKWLRGLLWGFGVEKQVQCVRFGAEARFINYGTYRVSYDNRAMSDEDVNVSFKPKNVRLSLRLSYIF